MYLAKNTVFFVTVYPNTFKCSYTLHFKSGEPLSATVTGDFSHIFLDKPIELNGYIDGLNPPKKTIYKIKIPKHLQYDFREEIIGW